MKLDKYHKLKLKLEVFKFEKNYLTLNQVLYYFSFLGNIFLIYFGYFFVKSITDTIPALFPFQETFFAIFIGLFLTGYELTKRFILEQLFVGIIQARKATLGVLLGFVISCILVAGSFYLSIKGAHRLVDNTETINTSVDSNVSLKQDSVARYYDQEIEYYRKQTSKTRADRKYRDSIVAVLQQTKDTKISEIENKAVSKSNFTLQKNQENDTAFLFITIFLELIVLIGVAFNAVYTLGSYDETKKLLQTPKFKQLELNLKLLKLYYQNGKKVPGDETISFNKFKSLVQTQKVDCTQTEMKSFIVLLQELDIVKQFRGRKKEFMLSYQQAKDLLENQEVV